MNTITPLIIIGIIVLWFIGLLLYKPFLRGRKPLYPRDDRIKWNFKAKIIRVIKVTISGGDSTGNRVHYEIWERRLFLFSVRYDAIDYRTIEEAKLEAQRLLQYEEIKTKNEEIVSI